MSVSHLLGGHLRSEQVLEFGGSFVSLGSGKIQPSIGFYVVLRHTPTPAVQVAKPILRYVVSLLSLPAQSPCSAALLNHFTASRWSFATPLPPRYMVPKAV